MYIFYWVIQEIKVSRFFETWYMWRMHCIDVLHTILGGEYYYVQANEVITAEITVMFCYVALCYVRGITFQNAVNCDQYCWFILWISDLYSVPFCRKGLKWSFFVPLIIYFVNSFLAYFWCLIANVFCSCGGYYVKFLCVYISWRFSCFIIIIIIIIKNVLI